MSERYREIEDYQADVVISQEDNIMYGTLYHKRPNLILLEFEEPEEQVLAVDGENLIIYVPYLRVVLKQKLKERDMPAAGLATQQGLDLMRQKYSVAYLDSPDLVPLESAADDEDGEEDTPAEERAEPDENSEMVWKLKLEWRSIEEGFREITLSVSEDLLIRRFVGVKADFEEIQVDFTNVELNQNIPDGRFRYEEPASANVIDDFIFEAEDEDQEAE